MGMVFPIETRFQKILLKANSLLGNPRTIPRGLMILLGLMDSVDNELESWVANPQG
jgi:hypothetical protein